MYMPGPGAQPYIEIIEQPQSKGFRFRYACEGKSHGGLQGATSRKDKKTFPTVRLRNYSGPVKVVASLVTEDESPKPHPHELVGQNCVNGVCTVFANGEEPVVSFPNVGIKHTTKKNVLQLLQNQLRESCIANKVGMVQHGVPNSSKVVLSDEEEETIRRQSEELSKDLQLSVVRIQFQAFLLNEFGVPVSTLMPVHSCPVHDSKAPCASLLKICRMDKVGGCCTGSEEVFLLCDKVQKDDIAIRFYEQDEYGSIHWEDYGQFGPQDVHRQYAIVFRTPAYHSTDIAMPASVHIQLLRRSDGEVSDPKTFVYYPRKMACEINGISHKKKRRVQVSNYLSPSLQENGMPYKNFPRVLEEYSPMSLGNQEVPHVPSPMFDRIGGFSSSSIAGLIGRGRPKTSDSTDEKPPPDDDQKSREKDGVDGEGVKKDLRRQCRVREIRLAEKIEQLGECLRLYSCTEDARFLISPLKALIKKQNEDGDNALHLSIIHNKAMAAFNLLSVLNSSPSKHLILDSLNDLHQSPVTLSVLTKASVHLKMLLESGCDVSYLTKDGDTLLHVAAKLDHPESIDLLLQHRPDHFVDVLDQFNYKGFTAMHLASERGHLGCLKSLVRHGADVQVKDQLSGKTALHHAIQGDHICVVAYLILETLVDVNSTTLTGVTPLKMASSMGHPQMVALLNLVEAELGTSDDVSSESDSDEEMPLSSRTPAEEEEELRRHLSQCTITDDQDRQTRESLPDELHPVCSGVEDSVASTLTKRALDSGIDSLHKEEYQESLNKEP